MKATTSLILSAVIMGLVGAQTLPTQGQPVPALLQPSAPVPPAAAGSRPKVTDTALDAALHDKKYLMRQLKCAMSEGPCDPVGKRLKSLAPLVLRGSCPQCSPSEVRQIQRTLSHIQRNYPKEWARVVRQFAGI